MEDKVKGKALAVAAAALLLLYGCSTVTPRVYPGIGKTESDAVNDSGVCQNWARGQTGFDGASDAVVGGAVGALVGALVGAAGGAVGGAIAGDAGKGAGIGAGVGAVLGAVGGGVYNYNNKQKQYLEAYAYCMRAKGHNVSSF